MAKKREAMFMRKATETDVDELYRIHTSAIRDTCSSHYNHQQVTAWVGRQHPERYLPFVGDGEIIVAQNQNQEIVGFGHSTVDKLLSAEERDGLPTVQIRGLFVDPGYTAQGVGSQILKHMEDQAISDGALMLTVLSSINAIHFYERYGFFVFSKLVEQKVTDDISLKCRRMKKILKSE